MGTAPPGPKDLPFVGNTHRYARDPFSFIEALTRSYSHISTFTLGTEQTYVITNPTDIERVLVSEEADYEKPAFLQTGAINDLLGDGLLLSGGEFWKRQRDRAQPAFAPGRVARYAETITEYAEAMTAAWHDGETITVDDEMARVTVKIIIAVMMGAELSDQTARQVQESLGPLGEMFEPGLGLLLPDWVPRPKKFEFRNAVDELEEVLDDIVRRRRPADGEEMDLLSILLRAQQTDEEVDADLLRDEMMTILLAGHDTTALSLTYSWYLLSHHPEVEARLHNELDDVLGGSPPTASDVRDLEYTEWVIQEAMRLYPPVYTIFREPQEDVTLAGYRLPAGSLIMLPQWGVHRDPRWYDAPDTFEPERWSRERVQDRPNYAYFPFGGGPRHCIGKHLSMLEAQLILSTVAQNYCLEYPSNASLDLHASLTMHPDDPLEMIVRKR